MAFNKSQRRRRRDGENVRKKTRRCTSNLKMKCRVESSWVEWGEKFSQLQPIINYATQWRNGNKYNWKTMSRHPSHITRIAFCRNSFSVLILTHTHAHTHTPSDTLHFECAGDENIYRRNSTTAYAIDLPWQTRRYTRVLGGISQWMS